MSVPSSPSGRLTSRPFEPQSAFGQANDANNSRFLPQSAFGLPAGGFVSGGAATGVFGGGSTRTPSPFSSEAAYGASSSSAFGATPRVGRTEFGNSSFEGQPWGSRVVPFNPTSIPIDEVTKLQSICGMTVPFYQYKSHEELRWEDYQQGDRGGPNHAGQSGVSVGRPGASPVIPRPTFSQSSPFPSTTTSNAVSSAPASTTTSNPVAPTPSGSSPFGFPPARASTPGTASHPSPRAVGSSIFRSSMPWGAQNQSLFRASSNPGSGLTTPAFGATSTPASGSTPTAAFGATSSSLFGSGRAFGASGNAAFGSSLPSGQSETAHTESQVGTPTVGRTEFGNSSFGGQPMGSRVAPFTPIPIDEYSGKTLHPKLQSICGMPLYECESHEELRWEDYRSGDKGGPNHAAQSGVSVGHPGASSAIPLPTFTQPSPFSSTTASDASSSAPASSGSGWSLFPCSPSPVLSTNADTISQINECPVCLTKPKNMAFGCGHMTCGECALKLSSYPICRQAISMRLRVYT